MGPRSSYEISFLQRILWGLFGCAATFGISLVVQRTTGTLVRLRMAPIGRMQILAGKGLACFVMTMVDSTVLLAIATLAEMLLPCVILVGVGIICFAVGARAFRWMHED